jgi:membrane protein YqaA with SNARE-associated domain
MSVTDQVLAALFLYGLPVLFSVILICSVGVPFPISLMLVAAGSFVEQGEMKLWQVVAVASVAAVLGDQIAYGLSRWGGRRLINRISRRIGGEADDKVAQKNKKFRSRYIEAHRELQTGTPRNPASRRALSIHLALAIRGGHGVPTPTDFTYISGLTGPAPVASLL